MDELFRKRTGAKYRETRTVVLLEAKATKSAILQELKTLAADSAPADAIVFFFAGRGLILSDRFCLVPHDAETGILEPQTGRHRRVLPCDDILDAVGDARALKRLVIFDTRMPVRRNDNAEVPDSNASLCGAVERMSCAHGVYTIAALTADETAHAIERLGHGVLTHAMLAGVGAADAQPIKRRFVLPVNPEQMVDAARLALVCYRGGRRFVRTAFRRQPARSSSEQLAGG